MTARALARRPAGTPARAVAAYLASLAPGKSRSTMRDCLRRVVASMGPPVGLDAFPWPSVGATELELLKARLTSEGLAPASVNLHIHATRGVLRRCFMEGLISAGDLEHLRMVKTVRGGGLMRGRALSHEELGRLFGVGACDRRTDLGLRNLAIIAILYGCGLRRAEAVALDVLDFDRRAGTLRVSGKGGKARLAYLPEGSMHRLRAWMARRGGAPGPLFRSMGTRGGVELARRLSGSTLWKVLATAARRAGLARFSPHDLRRTWVGDLLDAGVDLATVQRMAGHADVSTTARYDRRPERAQRDAARRLELPPTAIGG